MQINELNSIFFREKITLIFLLFIFSFGFGVLFFKYFHNFDIFGTKLSYFISVQTTIYLSIFLIFIYEKLVLKSEKKHENIF